MESRMREKTHRCERLCCRIDRQKYLEYYVWAYGTDNVENVGRLLFTRTFLSKKGAEPFKSDVVNYIKLVYRAIDLLSWTLSELLTLETSLICILLSASRDVHFDKRMICFLSGLFLKAHQSQNHEGKHIISRTQRFYVIFKSSLYRILWYAFMNRLTV